jgi:hypothetical protein
VHAAGVLEGGARGDGGGAVAGEREELARALWNSNWTSSFKGRVAFAHANRDSAGLSGTYSPIRACAKLLCLAAVCFSVACEPLGRRRQKLSHYDTKA